MINFGTHYNLAELVTNVLDVFPEHTSLATKSFEERSPDVLSISERTASLIKKLAIHVPGGMRTLSSDYRFLCEHIVPPEELYFRRNGKYRRSSFAEAQAEVYANADYMNRYMNGLLVSDVMWNNHSHALTYYVNTYLPSLPQGFDHLEVGPGHGLFLFYAATHPSAGSVTGWDVSPTSIANTKAALKTLGVTRPISLTLQNLFDGKPEKAQRFDSIVLSEILEHLEDPVAALNAVKQWLKPKGRIWVNVPSNSPAPDHLFLFDSPEHAVDIVKQAGLEIEDSAAYPMTGTTLDKARRRKMAISCLVTGRLP